MQQRYCEWYGVLHSWPRGQEDQQALLVRLAAGRQSQWRRHRRRVHHQHVSGSPEVRPFLQKVSSPSVCYSRIQDEERKMCERLKIELCVQSKIVNIKYTIFWSWLLLIRSLFNIYNNASFHNNLDLKLLVGIKKSCPGVLLYQESRFWTENVWYAEDRDMSRFKYRSFFFWSSPTLRY